MKETNNAVRVDDFNTPEYLGNGQYKWKCNFSLNNPAEMDGWVIQEIFVETQEVRDNTIVENYGLTTNIINYWEAWPVSKGTKEVKNSNGGLSILIRDCNDTYQSDSKLSKRSVEKANGFLKFFEGELPDTFHVNNKETFAGPLQSTRNRPDFWNRANSSLHVLECEANCEGKEEEISIIKITTGLYNNGKTKQEITFNYYEKSHSLINSATSQIYYQVQKIF